MVNKASKMYDWPSNHIVNVQVQSGQDQKKKSIYIYIQGLESGKLPPSTGVVASHISGLA